MVIGHRSTQWYRNELFIPPTVVRGNIIIFFILTSFDVGSTVSGDHHGRPSVAKKK